MTALSKKSLKREFSKLYRIDLDDDYLNSFFSSAVAGSKSIYKNLSSPKVMQEETYIRFRTRILLHEDLSKKTIKGFNTSNPPSEYRKTSKFINIFPFKKILLLNRDFYNADQTRRVEKWKEFNLPIKEIERYFKGMVQEQNQFAIQHGFTSKVSFMLKRCKIPKNEYEYFITQADEVIDYCNKQLPKAFDLPSLFLAWYNIPCYFCQMPAFPLKGVEQIRDLMGKKYPALEKYKYKIEIKLTDGRSKSAYQQEADSILISINRNVNSRHKSLDLVHEFAHVAHMINDFKNGIIPSEKGTFLNEKEAGEIEFEILKSISKELYHAQFASYLLQFRQTLFEIELYKNPHQNLSKLYANTFNKCFKGAKQKENPLYLLEENIVNRPFSTLPHAIAQAQIVKGHIGLL